MGTDPASIDQRLGARIREQRAALGLTLDALAQRADVSRAMLSRVEHGESSPTAQLLDKICAGLGLTLSALFAQTEAPAAPLVRHADQPVWRDPASGYVRRSVSVATPSLPVDLTEVVLPPGARVGFDNARSPTVVQHVWVLAGTLDLRLGETDHRLAAGDCLAMRLDQPILFGNVTEDDVRYAVLVGRPDRI